MNHYINMLFILQAKADGRPIERATLYVSLHTRKDGTAVNPIWELIEMKVNKTII